MFNLERFTAKYLEPGLKYLVAAVFIFIPLYPKFPLFFVPGSTVAVRMEDFLIAISLLLFLLIHLPKIKKLSNYPLFFQVAIFILAGVLSTISALAITKNVVPTIVLLHFFRRVEYLATFFLSYYVASRSKQNQRFLLQLVFLPVIGVFVYGVAQIYFRAPVISTMNSEFSKGYALTLEPGVQISSTFSGHYDLAIYLAMILCYLFVLMIQQSKTINRIFIYLCSVFVMWLFAQAGSRIGIFGLVMAISYVGFINRKKGLAIIFVTTIFLSLLTSPSLINRIGNIIRVFQTKVNMTSQFSTVAFAQEDDRAIQQDRSSSIRFDVEWPRAIRSFLKNPLFGTGYSSLTLATDNDYLRSLGETGLIGLLSFISVLLSVFLRISNKLRAKDKSTQLITNSSLAILIVILISGLFLDVFEASKIAILFWLFMGLSIGSINEK